MQSVLTATVDGVKLVAAIGWKQDHESDLFFILTRGLCSTRPDPSKRHVQWWNDANGHRCERLVPDLKWHPCNSLATTSSTYTTRSTMERSLSSRIGKHKNVAFGSVGKCTI